MVTDFPSVNVAPSAGVIRETVGDALAVLVTNTNNSASSERKSVLVTVNFKL